MNDNADEANDRVSPPPTDEAQDSGETTDRPAPPVTPQSAEAPSSAADAPEAAAGEDDILVPGSPSALGDPYGDEEFDLSREDFEKLLSEHEDMIGEFREGEIVNAKVLRVTENSVILDFGFKSEGSVALEEFKDPSKLQIGEEVEVLLESLEDDDGVVILSKKKADFLRVWEKIKEAHEADRPVKGVLARKIKGGVTVDLMGVDAFLPGSQIALRRVPNIEDLLGRTYDFKIIKLNKRRRNIVVSHRVILEAQRERKRDTLVKELLVGQVREGVVKNITDFGAFIDLGGLDGLLHITDMSWGRVGHPSEVVEIAQELDIKVLDIDWDRERISLGLKQLLPYPWTDIEQKYAMGSRVWGRVVSITNYGAFVELEKGVEGLVHISEMSWTRNVRHPSKLLTIGDEIEAVVLRVDASEEKISLGMKQIEEDPWLSLPAKYPTGTVLSGMVRNLTSFGAFVEIEPGIDGLVHVSDMSWTKRIGHPSEVIRKGKEIEVMVLDVDSENKRISLGLRQLEEDPWPKISVRFSAGVETEGKVARVQEKGLVVDLGDDIEGFVPGSHAGIENSSQLDQYFWEGDPVELKILESDAGSRRIVLEVTSEPEKKPPPEEPSGEEDAEAEEEPSEDAPDQDGEERPTDEAVTDEEVEDEAVEEEVADEAVTDEEVEDEEVADEAVTDEEVADEAVEDDEERDEAVEEEVADEADEEEVADEERDDEERDEEVADEEVADEAVTDEEAADEAEEEEVADEERDEAVTDEEVEDEEVADEAVTDEEVEDEAVDEEVADEAVTDEEVEDEAVEEEVADEAVTDEEVADEAVEEEVADEAVTDEEVEDEEVEDEAVEEEVVADEERDEEVTDEEEEDEEVADEAVEEEAVEEEEVEDIAEGDDEEGPERED